MNFYNVPLPINIINVLKALIVKKLPTQKKPDSFLIVAPNKKALAIFKQNLKLSNTQTNSKFKIIAISETKHLLKEFLPYAPKFLQSEIKNTLNIQVINNYTRTFLISNLIKKAKFFSTIDNIWPLANNLANILDILESENISLEEIKALTVTGSIFNDGFINILINIYPHWNQLLQDLKVSNILCYRSKVFNLLAKTIQHINPNSNFNIITFAIDNYSSSTIKFLYSISKYQLGKVIFSGIDFNIEEIEWNQLNRSHAQYISSKILKKLNLSRKYIKNLNELLPSNYLTPSILKEEELYNKTSSLDIIKTIFNPIPCKISTLNQETPLGNKKQPTQLNLFNIINTQNCSPLFHNISYIEVSNEEEESSLIVKLIEHELKTYPNKHISLVTTNSILVKKIIFKLNLLNIEFDNSFGNNLNSTPESIFFTLISSINLNNINFVDLLSLLKHPLCIFYKNLHFTYLIDLHLSRTIFPGSSLDDYLELLNKLLKQKTISDEDYLGIKETLQSLKNIFSEWQKLNKASLNFNETLKLHIEIANQLYINTPNDTLWNSLNGKTLKTLLDGITQDINLVIPLNLHEYNNIIQRLINQCTVRAPVLTNAKVYIGGILQAQFIANNTIIIADMNEGSFPTTPTLETPFINQIFYKFQLPHSYDNIGKEGFIFQKLCYQTKVYITRSLKTQHNTTTISRFLVKLFNTLELNKININNSLLENLKSSITPTFSFKHQTPVNNTIIEAKVPICYRPQNISTTNIEKLLQNPYVFFIEQILNLKPLLPINPSFNNLISGILVHETIDKFFYKYKNTSLKNLTQIEEYLIHTANQVFKPYINKYPNSLLILNVFKYFLPNIAKSIHYIAKNTMHFHNEISGKLTIEYKNSPININGRADCIALTNEGALIIDFKTGSQTSLKTDISKHRKQLIVLGYILLNKGFFSKEYKLNNLEYWIIPNTFSNKFSKIKLNNNLNEPLLNYVNTNLDNIIETIHTFLYTETSFKLNLKHNNIINEYKHFSRKEELLPN